MFKFSKRLDYLDARRHKTRRVHICPPACHRSWIVLRGLIVKPDESMGCAHQWTPLNTSPPPPPHREFLWLCKSLSADSSRINQWVLNYIWWSPEVQYSYMPPLPVSSFRRDGWYFRRRHCEDPPAKEFWDLAENVRVCDETNVTRQDKNVIWIWL